MPMRATAPETGAKLSCKMSMFQKVVSSLPNLLVAGQALALLAQSDSPKTLSSLPMANIPSQAFLLMRITMT